MSAPPAAIEDSNKQVQLQISGQTVCLNLNVGIFAHEAIYKTCQDGWVYEPMTVLTLSQFLEPGDVFIDGGAHIGYYSVIAAAMVGRSGKVIAFEPDPINHKWLSEEIELNNFRDIILPIECAIGASLGLVTLYENKANDGGHALWPMDTFEATPGICLAGGSRNVQQVTIDCITEKVGLSKVKAIKLDVEGAEVLAIRGAVKTIATLSVELIIVEIHVNALQAMGTSVSELLKILTELGYVGFSAPDGNYSRITFDGNYQPTGQWWQHHQVCIENLYFIHRSSSKLASLVPSQDAPTQR